MNIFGIGSAELVLIIIIMLIVAGPKRMAQWAYIIGQYLGKFRQMWSQMIDMVQAEIDDAGIDLKLPKDPPTRQNMNTWARDAFKPISDPIEEARKEVDDNMKKARDAISFEIKPMETAQPHQPKRPTPPAEKPATPTDDETFGTWGGVTEEIAQNGSTPPPDEDTGSLGAWSNLGNRE